MSSLLHEVRRTLTEDPDLAIIDGLRNTPMTGWCFLFHEDAGFLKARRMGKTHWELVYDWVAKQFPELGPRALQSITDVERLKVKWSGRWWEENDIIHVAFWEHEKYLPFILQQFGDEAPIDMSEALYQCWDNAEDEWYNLTDVMRRNPTLTPLPTTNPIMDRKIAAIRAELHTATPERKTLLRQMLRILNPAEDEDPVSVTGEVANRAGFRSPVEMNYARRQESIGNISNLGSAWMSPFGQLTMLGLGETHAGVIHDGEVEPGDMDIVALEAWAVENRIDTDDNTWPVDAAIKLGWCRLKHARAINALYIVSRTIPSGSQRRALKAIHDDHGIQILVDTGRGEARPLFEAKDQSVSTKGLPQNFDGVSLKKDGNGFYVHTHRSRSKSYVVAAKIPQSVINHIETTG